MKLIKITLTSLKNESTSFFTVPQADEFDEKGNPVFNEKVLLELQQFKDFLELTNTPILNVKYEIIAISDEIISVNFKVLKTLEDKGQTTLIDRNDFPLFYKDNLKQKKNKHKGASA